MTIDNPAIWMHINANVDKIVTNWLMLDTNAFIAPEVKYFSLYLIRLVLDLIWKSNYNVTTIRRFGAVLAKAARDIENIYHGGFKKLVHVRLVSKVGMVKEDHLLRKRVQQYYAIKAICLTKKASTLDDFIEFANIKIQIDDKECELTSFFPSFFLKVK